MLVGWAPVSWMKVGEVLMGETTKEVGVSLFSVEGFFLGFRV